MPGIITDPTQTPTGDATPATPAVPPSAAEPAAPAPQTQNLPKPEDTSGAQDKGLSEAEVKARIEKARSDEKKKAFDKLEAAKADKASSEEKIQKLEADLQSATKNLDELRQGKSTEIDSLTKEFQELRDKNAKLEKAIETVADDAAKQVMEAKVEAYRDKVIAQKSVMLSELVTGNTIEEIDESVERALAREKEIQAKAAGGSGDGGNTPPTQDPAPQTPPAPADPNLPRPLSPDGSQGRGPGPDTSPQNRENLSKLPREEYLKVRNQMMAEAKRKAGLI